MADLSDLIDDPIPLDETDPEVIQEIFEIHEAMGARPEDLTGGPPELRDAYSKWLKRQTGTSAIDCRSSEVDESSGGSVPGKLSDPESSG